MRRRAAAAAAALLAATLLVPADASAHGLVGKTDLPIPSYLLARGVRDMVRVSDARMSGTSYGACVLHVAPESHVGGPLAFVRSGDPVTLDVASRTLSLDVPERELASRQARWRPPAARFERGYGALYGEHVTQANQGCDFDFLARRGAYPEPNPQ